VYTGSALPAVTARTKGVSQRDTRTKNAVYYKESKLRSKGERESAGD
jgi:hypothetical protein